MRTLQRVLCTHLCGGDFIRGNASWLAEDSPRASFFDVCREALSQYGVSEKIYTRGLPALTRIIHRSALLSPTGKGVWQLGAGKCVRMCSGKVGGFVLRLLCFMHRAGKNVAGNVQELCGKSLCRLIGVEIHQHNNMKFNDLGQM